MNLIDHQLFRDWHCTYMVSRQLSIKKESRIVVVILLFYVHGKHLRSCWDGQLT